MFKDVISSPTFCVLPWIHMATRTSGAILPCCVGGQLKDNLNCTTFTKAWNGNSMKELRKKMIDGKKSSICNRCYNEEKAALPSNRIRSNDYWGQYLSLDDLKKGTNEDGSFDGKILFFDLRIGNKCNLVCNMCGPQESMLWNSMTKQIYKLAKEPLLKEYMAKQVSSILPSQNQNWYKRKEITQDIYANLSFVRRIVIAGGEPLLIKEHYDLLDECIHRKEASHITLHYHTNGTIVRPELFEKWKYFETVMVFISLDGLREQNHYIRYPCSWKLIEKNLHLFDKESPANVHPMVLYTIQAMNIFYMPDFISWLVDGKFKKLHLHDGFFHTEVVHNPYFLSCQVLPSRIKEKIMDKFQLMFKMYDFNQNRIQSILDFMNIEDKTKHLSVFKDYISILDKIRGTSFAKTFPEIAEISD
ncbi:MAG: twitch domain-containing radical SAM protein [Halobacteriovoraceae bacterium]|nr:twitch domain-containing radical SAM protein [Halobacteriovoraceae bacterium]